MPGCDDEARQSGPNPGSDLEFPVEPEFRPAPPQLEFESMLRRIAETMPWRSTRPGEQERRLREKIPQEFVL